MNNNDDAVVIIDKNSSVLSPSQRRITDIPDPYQLDDAQNSTKNLGLMDDKSRDFTKSAKTVIKRPFGSFKAKVFDLTSDPISLGLRPSTSI